jgi:hypothetical protein
MGIAAHRSIGVHGAEVRRAAMRPPMTFCTLIYLKHPFSKLVF